MKHDLLSDVLSTIKNGDSIGKDFVIVGKSALTKNVLDVMKKHGFIGEIENFGERELKIMLLGNVNAARSIRPRYSVRADGYDKYKRRFLPASGVGIIIISTSRGVLDHRDGEEKKVGGKLLAYVY
jgi:small subunit ribosomal protein S8